MRMALKPTLKQQLKDYCISGGIFFLVNVVLVALPFVGLLTFGVDDTNISYSGYGFSCAIFMLVMGIVLPRQSMRLGVQMGVSRRTTFLGLLISTLVGALALLTAGEALMTVAQALAPAGSNLYFSDFYWLLYGDGSLSHSLVQHLTSILFNTTLMLLAFGLGLFFTFLFWRLNKFGCVIAGIAIPVVLLGLPGLAAYFQDFFAPLLAAFERLMTACAMNEWIAMAFFLVVAAVSLGIGWLLICRTNIRGTALK